MPAPVNSGGGPPPVAINYKSRKAGHTGEYFRYGDTAGLTEAELAALARDPDGFWALFKLGYDYNWPFPWPPNGPVPSSTNRQSTLDNRNKWGSIASQGSCLPLIYGRQRINGELIYQQESSPPWYALFTFVLGEGAIDGIDAAYLNGVNVTYYVESVFGTQYVTVDSLALGTIAQTPYPRTAYAITKIEDKTHPYNPDWSTLFTSREWFFDVRGLKVYDMRGGLQDPTDPSTWTFSANAALVIRDFLTDPVHGCGIPLASINDDSFHVAADDCDTFGFEINMAIVADTTAQSVREQMELACRGHIYLQDGLYCLFIDKANTSITADFNTNTNCRGVSYEPLGTQDIPTRVTLDYVNAGNKYATEATTVDSPGVATGATPVREARYKADAITSSTQAQRIAAYVLNKASFSLRVSFTAAYIGVNLKYGDIITLTTDEGLASQQMFVEFAEEQDNGEWTIRARRYDSTIFNYSAVTPDTPPATWLFGLVPPPPPAAVRHQTVMPPTGSSAGMAWDAPRAYAQGGPYGASYWSISGTGASGDTSKINDGNTTVVAVTSTSAMELYLDLGGAPKAFGRLDFWIDALLADFFQYGTFAVEYSDDGMSYVDALTSSVGYHPTTPWQDAAVAGVYPCHIEIPDSIGSHRWWKIAFYGIGAGLGTMNLYEARFNTFTAYAGTIIGYEVRVWQGGSYDGAFPLDLMDYSTPDSNAPVVLRTTTLPTDIAPFNDVNAAALFEVIGNVFETQASTFRCCVTSKEFYSSSSAAPHGAREVVSASYTPGSLNGISLGAVTLVAGSNVTITPGAPTPTDITIASSGGGGGSGNDMTFLLMGA